MRPITEYSSCLDLLRDAFANASASDRQANLKSFAKSMGIAISTLHMLLNGKRNLTLKHVQTLATSLKLAETERSFIETLFLRDYSRKIKVKGAIESSRSHYANRLQDLRDAAHMDRVRYVDRFTLSDWRIPALLIYLLDVFDANLSNSEQADWQVLSERFQLPEKTIREWVDRLQNLGFVKFNSKEGQYIIMDGVARCIPQTKYLTSVLRQFLHRISSHYTDPLHVFRSFTFFIAPEDLPSLKAELNDIFERYANRRGTSSDVIATAFLGIIPVTKQGRGPKNKSRPV